MTVRKSLICLFVCIFSFTPISILSKELIPGGENVGIKMEYEGVAVVSTFSFQVDNKVYQPSKYLQNGDIIIGCNHQKVTTLQQLTSFLNEIKNEVVPITIVRNHQTIATSMYYIYDSNSNTYMSGLYLHDNITGIGTITYYDPEYQSFGALGHAILDQKGKENDYLNNGTIYPSNVSAIMKAKKGIPGEKHANIDYDSKLGIIHHNHTLGIYGNYLGTIERDAIETAIPKEGKAIIYTVLEDDKVEQFDILITSINQNKEKSITLQITDERLLQITGGIVQGMSGSPILQDGKLVGAVTHVLVNNPTRGYGIFIENMLDAAE